MKVGNIVDQTIKKVTPDMHVHRRNALISVINSLLLGASATVTSIGRGLQSSTKEKHRIKRADRLLSTPNLQQESQAIYQEVAKFTLGHNQRPIILIDWSDLDEYKRHFLLRASLASHKRSIPIFEEVHTIKTKEKPTTHRQFLLALARVLPHGCKPIIVTDAGFKTPWFREVIALGWDFVGRTRLPNFYSTHGKDWQCITHLYQKSNSTAQLLSGFIARRNPLKCHLVFYKAKGKGRHALNRSGLSKKSKRSQVHRKSANDPWLLSTSLPDEKNLAKRVVKIYRMRMQIEESFRDMKSKRFGQGFEYNKTTDKRRLSVLVFLTTLAHWLLMVLGLMAKIENRHRDYQANSVKKINVLSLPFIGRRVALDKWYKPKMKSVLIAIDELQKTSGSLDLIV